MRNYKAVIKQACLLSSSPQEVVQFLEQRAAKIEEIRFEYEVDEELEHALLRRDDPLINLSLASYAFYESVVRKLFEKAQGQDEYSKGLRFAVLSNQCVTTKFPAELPRSLFDNEEQSISWITSTSIEEILVLFENPSLSDSFLRDFLEGKEYWQAMDEERRLAAVAALSRNERMKTPYNETFMDGYAEYSYGAVFDAAWKLAESAPVTDDWAVRLHWLFHTLERTAFSIEKPLELTQRWLPDANNAEIIKREEQDIENGYLGRYQNVRKELAILALSKSSALLPQLFNDNDVALRCAAYAEGNLTPEQITTAYERDGQLAFMESVNNKHLWRKLATREALREIAWAVVNNDKYSDLMAANIFKGMKERMAKEYPDWFRDEDYEPEINDGKEPVTKDDLNRAAETIINQSTTLFIQNLSKLNKRIGWIWWFSLGATVIFIIRHY